MEHYDNGFKWVQVGEEPYMTRRGEEITLRVWQSACVVCGADIQCKTPMDFSTAKGFGLRRCSVHKGKPMPWKW